MGKRWLAISLAIPCLCMVVVVLFWGTIKPSAVEWFVKEYFRKTLDMKLRYDHLAYRDGKVVIEGLKLKPKHPENPHLGSLQAESAELELRTDFWRRSVEINMLLKRPRLSIDVIPTELTQSFRGYRLLFRPRFHVRSESGEVQLPGGGTYACSLACSFSKHFSGTLLIHEKAGTAVFGVGIVGDDREITFAFDKFPSSYGTIVTAKGFLKADVANIEQFTLTDVTQSRYTAKILRGEDIFVTLAGDLMQGTFWGEDVAIDHFGVSGATLYAKKEGGTWTPDSLLSAAEGSYHLESGNLEWEGNIPLLEREGKIQGIFKNWKFDGTAAGWDVRAVYDPTKERIVSGEFQYPKLNLAEWFSMPGWDVRGEASVVVTYDGTFSWRCRNAQAHLTNGSIALDLEKGYCIKNGFQIESASLITENGSFKNISGVATIGVPLIIHNLCANDGQVVGTLVISDEDLRFNGTVQTHDAYVQGAFKLPLKGWNPQFNGKVVACKSYGELSADLSYNHPELHVKTGSGIFQKRLIGIDTFVWNIKTHTGMFDVWWGDDSRDVVRIVGESKEGVIDLDTNKSHVGALSVQHASANVLEKKLTVDFRGDLGAFENDLKMMGYPSPVALGGQLQGTVSYDEDRMLFELKGENILVDQESFSTMYARGGERNGAWEIDRCVLDAWACSSEGNYTEVKRLDVEGEGLLASLSGRYDLEKNRFFGSIKQVQLHSDYFKFVAKGGSIAFPHLRVKMPLEIVLDKTSSIAFDVDLTEWKSDRGVWEFVAGWKGHKFPVKLDQKIHIDRLVFDGQNAKGIVGDLAFNLERGADGYSGTIEGNLPIYGGHGRFEGTIADSGSFLGEVKGEHIHINDDICLSGVHFPKLVGNVGHLEQLRGQGTVSFIKTASESTENELTSFLKGGENIVLPTEGDITLAFVEGGVVVEKLERAHTLRKMVRFEIDEKRLSTVSWDGKLDIWLNVEPYKSFMKRWRIARLHINGTTKNPEFTVEH